MNVLCLPPFLPGLYPTLLIFSRRSRFHTPARRTRDNVHPLLIPANNLREALTTAHYKYFENPALLTLSRDPLDHVNLRSNHLEWGLPWPNDLQFSELGAIYL